MINVSNKIKSACSAPSNAEADYIVLEGQKIVINAKLKATAYKDNTFIGTFNLKTLEFEAENNVRYRNKEFTYYKEIDGESFKIGTFIVTDIKDKDTQEIVKVTAMDYGLKFAIPYESGLPYASGQVTLLDVLHEACQQAGVELENTAITNGNLIVDSNQFVNDELIGDVIAAIATTTADFATINNNDKLELIFNKNTNIVINDYEDLDDKRDTHAFTGVILGQKDIEGQEAVRKDQALMEKYGEKNLIINDSPFLYTYEKREAAVDAIFNKIKGFGYSSFRSTNAYIPYLTLGDKIQFKNKEGQLVNSLILKYEISEKGSTFEAPSLTSSSVDYTRPDSPMEIAKRTQIIVNQAEGKILAVAAQTNKNATDINNNYQDMLNKFDLVATKDQLESYEKSMRAEMDANKLEIASVNKIIANGVEKVVTTTGTFDNDGLTMDRTGAKTKSLLNEIGLDILDKQGTSNDLLYAGYVTKQKAESNPSLKPYEGQTVVYTNNMIVDNYLSVGTHARYEDYLDGTGCFYTERK